MKVAITIGQLKELLEGWSDDIEIVVQTRTSMSTDAGLTDDDINPDEVDGMLWDVEDDRSFTVEYGKLNIIADYKGAE